MVTIWIDPPAWPAHGRLWSHLISDESIAELNDFAAGLGIPRRGFEGDHYDIPAEYYERALASGAVETTGRDLLRRLQASGLRLPKRRGDKGIERVTGWTLADGTRADIDLILSPREMTDERIFAAMVFVQDVGGRHLLTWSERRQEWGAPGGWREGDESPVANAVREAEEESGLVLDPADLRPVGYERFRRDPHTPAPGLWVPGRDILQVYAANLSAHRPPVRVEEPGQPGPEWVEDVELGERCRDSFWWPLAARVLALEQLPEPE